MDNILIVVNDLEVAKTFFAELGIELEGKMTVEGPLVDPLIVLQNVRATLALMRTPAGHGRIELDKFHMPEAIRTGGEVVQYEDTYQLTYIRGPEGIIVGLSEQLKQAIDHGRFGEFVTKEFAANDLK